MARLGTQSTVRQAQQLTLTPSLRAALDILRMDASELTRHLELAAAQNPWIALRAPAATARPGTLAGGMAQASADGVEAAGDSLSTHVLNWIEARFPDGRARRIALHFAEALEPSGWIAVTCPEVARAERLPLAEVEAVLARLHRIEPTGLFARNLAECLSLQAAEAGALDPVMSGILDRLDLLGRGDLPALARHLRTDVETIRARVRVIRSFDPKPGARFGAEPVLPAPPELIAQREPEGWFVVPAQGAVPRVQLRADAPVHEADVAAARALIDALDRRMALLLRVGTEMVHRQARAMEEGPARLVPLTRGAVAAVLGLHESTISRATAGLRILTPHGPMAANAFFPSALGDGAVSSAAVKAALQRLVADEDGAAPLSDAALAEALSARQMPVARRTVAKYREGLGIPPAFRRRR
jgi:RNA polymerase sigma-54 factor